LKKVNPLYLTATVASGASFETCIENVDIGGPSMLRSSAKNHAYITIATSPSQYDLLIEEMKSNDGCSLLETRKKLAYAAFNLSAAYDSTIANYFASKVNNTENNVQSRTYKPQVLLKYGCNPHQKPAGIYSIFGDKMPFKVINGTPGKLLF
jgi:phosphoribosylaminoimidazolecarboxamide formyltransferase/IMP cyclohydrolase